MKMYDVYQVPRSGLRIAKFAMEYWQEQLLIFYIPFHDLIKWNEYKLYLDI